MRKYPKKRVRSYLENFHSFPTFMIKFEIWIVLLIIDFAIHQFLLDYWGTEALKAMDILTTYNEQKDAGWNAEAFLKMEILKFLRIFGFLYVPSHLPNDLRILDWILNPSKSLPSSFQLNELVQLCLQWSKIERLWIGVKVSVLLNILLTLCF